MTPIREREIRTLTRPLELRSEGDGIGTLVGYASLFNVPFNPFYDWPEFTEVVHPDAFNRTLREMPDVLALKNHNADKVLGRVSAGTLRLNLDQIGLGFENDLPDNTDGRDSKVSVDRRDITGCSIGFVTNKDDVVSDRDTGLITRTLLDVDLFEVTTVCTFPANQKTQVSVRALIESRASTSAPSPRPNLELLRLILRRSGRRSLPIFPRS
jgi:HK97 family phage prohead protease